MTASRGIGRLATASLALALAGACALAGTGLAPAGAQATEGTGPSGTYSSEDAAADLTTLEWGGQDVSAGEVTVEAFAGRALVTQVVEDASQESLEGVAVRAAAAATELSDARMTVVTYDEEGAMSHVSCSKAAQLTWEVVDEAGETAVAVTMDSSDLPEDGADGAIVLEGASAWAYWDTTWGEVLDHHCYVTRNGLLFDTYADMDKYLDERLLAGDYEAALQNYTCLPVYRTEAGPLYPDGTTLPSDGSIVLAGGKFVAAGAADAGAGGVQDGQGGAGDASGVAAPGGPGEATPSTGDETTTGPATEEQPDPEPEKVWVVDAEAWDEPVYDTVSVLVSEGYWTQEIDYYGYLTANGKWFDTYDDLDKYLTERLLAGDYEAGLQGYACTPHYVDKWVEPVYEDQQVQVDTIHHKEEGHWE